MRKHWRLRIGVMLLLSLTCLGWAWAQEPQPRPRVIEIKIDGTSPLLVDALLYPEDPVRLNRLPDPEGFRRAIQLFRYYTDREDLLPNLRHYIYVNGVRVENIFSATVTLSAVSWALIDSGQPSVVKQHMSFSRQTGYCRSHLDGFRDTMEFILRRGRKTNALWTLDQVGISLLRDAFNPLRVYTTPQIYYRLTPASYLTGLATAWLNGGRPFARPWEIVAHHLGRRVKGMDYPDFAEDFVADHLAEKILERDFSGQERYDYLSTLFSVINHQHQVDTNPENLVYRMVRLDRRLGRIFRAVEMSQRRDHTLVFLISDHGSEYEPGKLHVSFPLTKAFRTKLFGGHTVATVMAEDAVHALTTPIQGIDFPRVYESSYSPYGQAQPHGEEGYVTAFIDNFGNARAEIHLRNNDLNRLHLLLLARHRPLSQEQRARLRLRLQETLAAIRVWLEPELASYHDYHAGVRAWLPQLEKRADPYWRDAAARLHGEAARDDRQLRALDRLWQLVQAPDALAWLEAHNFSVREIIPKKYLGPANTVLQLRHYTIGLDANLDWVETTTDDQGRPVPMDYFHILKHYRAPNPPANGEANPFDLIVAALPVEAVAATARRQGWLDESVTLCQALWVVSTTENNPLKGGEALLLEAADGSLRYVPVSNLTQAPDGSVEFALAWERDPLGWLYDPYFQPPTGEPAAEWFQAFHTPEDWLHASYNTRYSHALGVFSNMFRDNALAFVNNPDFQRTLTGFPSAEAKQRYVRGLRWKYTAQQPDLRVWSTWLWNFSSKSYTAGGAHGGLSPQVARTMFYAWGGAGLKLRRGLALTEPCTTLDIVPTIAAATGMLAEGGRVQPQPGAVRDRAFLPYPGRVLPLSEAALAAATQPRRPISLFDLPF